MPGSRLGTSPPERAIIYLTHSFVESILSAKELGHEHPFGTPFAQRKGGNRAPRGNPMAGWRGLPALRRPRSHYAGPWRSAGIEAVRRLQEAVHGQGRHDLRIEPYPAAQMVPGGSLA